MLKWIGGACVIAGAAALGFSAVFHLSSRVSVLRSLVGALGLMERELSFRTTPMPELLDELSKRTPAPVNGLFAHCRAGLSRLNEKDLAQLWREGLETVSMGLNPEETELLGELGEILGRYDSDGQQMALSRTRNQMEQCLAEAREERARQGKMYGVLGLSAGALLVIMLV